MTSFDQVESSSLQAAVASLLFGMAAERSPRPDVPAVALSADARAGRLCARCGATVPWRVQRFCMDLRSRFGGRVYCLACQRAFPTA